MRPQSIRYFEYAYIASVLIGLFNLILHWDVIAGQTLAKLPPDSPVGAGAMSTIMVGSTLAGLLINLALWYFAATRASRIARAIVLILALFGLLGLVMQFAGQSGYPAAMRILGAAAVAAQLAAAWFLFRRDANAWFRSGGQGDAAD